MSASLIGKRDSASARAFLQAGHTPPSIRSCPVSMPSASADLSPAWVALGYSQKSVPTACDPFST
ncbi:hypothetical protein M513_11394 [Trichuris suis]|uniref:Uncharacterized protein n=1 Tax=Trichuris suis TaxID=68888 RepID=A0A085LRX0_9BILA|nr:hypothetical protein M513_11394 [Trichuris suis]